jgi:hypothetical protein
MNATQYDSQREKLLKRQQIAEALMSQGMSGGPQGQMVSGRYVAPSMFASLAPILSAAAGKYADNKATGELTSLDDAQGADITKAIEAYTSAAPENRQAALSGLLSSTTKPQDAAKLLVAQAMSPKTHEKPVAISRDGRPVYVSSDDAIGQTPYDATSDSAPVAILGDDGKPKLVSRADAIGKTPYDKPTAQTSVNVNTDKSLYGTLAEQQAKQYSDLYSQAQAAPERIDRAARVRSLLQAVPYTGTGADWKLAIGKGAKSLGFNYAGDDLANTELLGRELAGSTLEAIKASGLGGGSGFSNADRDFLEKVTGGSISMDPKSLQRIAELNDRAARSTIKRWNDTAGRLKPDQLQSLGMTPIDSPPEMTQQTNYPNGIQDLMKDPHYSKFFQQAQ